MKPSLSVAEITRFLAELLGEAPTSVGRLVEGLESQAFRFGFGGDTFVVRVNGSIRGFEKDRWASETVGTLVPVPRVLRLGWLDADHAFCISEFASGVTLEGLDPSDVEQFVADVHAAWAAIAEADVSAVAGFGDFEADGRAPALGWRDVLRTTLDRAAEDLPDAAAVVEAYGELIDRCPEERALIHGDFGSNNIVAEAKQIRAVLDWEHAMVGDPLYDVANAYFWATHLRCMQLQAEHFDRTVAGLPAYRDRIACYALRIGLEEAHESVRAGDRTMATWALARCRALLEDAARR